MKNKIGRGIAFLVALVALGVAALSISSFLGDSSSGGGGGISLGLCSLASPEDLAIGAYLDSKAAELEQPAGTNDEPVTFVIEPGETVEGIAGRLEAAGLVSDAELFRRYVQYHGLDVTIEAGEFTLRQTMTIPQVAQALQQGQRPQQEVVVQEGLRLEQVATQVGASTTIAEQEFLALATSGWREASLSYGFLADLPPDATLEGFLYPATYQLDEDAAAIDLLRRMLDAFEANVGSDVRAAAANQGLSLYELVTLASIVEREAVLDEERATIASVYHNRLALDWPLLAADPTVQYALGTPADWWPVLTLDDTQIESPYNTYRNRGLPPTPICSPGISSIEATAYPAETSYYYFLADCEANDGSHLFSVTEEEHLANYERCGGIP